MVRASVLGDRALDEFSGVADGYEQQKAGMSWPMRLKMLSGCDWGSAMLVAIFFSFSSVELLEFVLQGLKPRVS